MSLNKQDLQAIGKVVRDEVLVNVTAIVRPQFKEINNQLQSMDKKINTLTSSVDGLTGTTLRVDQEIAVLGAQQDKVKHVLVKKRIATEDQLAVI